MGVNAGDNGEEAQGRCATCTHWQNPWQDGEPWVLADRDEAPRWGTCLLIGMADSYGEKVSLPAFTKDASDYKADLHTRADFGCVLHQASANGGPT